MKKLFTAFYATLACVMPLTAFAGFFDLNNSCYPVSHCCEPWYLFGGVDHDSSFHVNRNEMSGSPESWESNSSLGWQIFGGRKFTSWFALELGFVQFGRQYATFVDDNYVSVSGCTKGYAIPFRMNFFWNFYKDLSAGILLGAHYHNNRSQFSAPLSDTITEKHCGVHINCGGVLEYKPLKHLGLRLEAARYYDNYSFASNLDYQDIISANLVTYF